MPTPRNRTPFRIGAARHFRKHSTYGEQLLWRALRRKQIGFHVRRQYPVGPYILDFYITVAKVAVEIDGLQHDNDHDSRRDRYLESIGIMVIRIPRDLLAEQYWSWVVAIQEVCRCRVEGRGLPEE